MAATTTSQRTYRYVRIGILVAVLAIGVSLTVEIVGSGPLSSVSAMYYTPARNVFVGALFAIALAFLVLAGRGPSQALLDLAALVAPVIALVPTPLRPGERVGQTSGCETVCVPATEFAAIDNAVAAYLVVASAALAAAIVLAVIQRTLTRPLAVTFVVAAALIAASGCWWAIAPASFAQSAHLVAALGFFALVAAVSALAGRGSGGGLRTGYLVVAGLIVVDLIAVVAFVLARGLGGAFAETTIPVVLIGEAAALVLFAVFWTLQTVQFWRDDDPALRAAR